MKHVKPHALIGLTGGGPAFGQDVIEALCSTCEHPLIFPLSNPTEKAEITAENAYNWSKGKCLFASGVLQLCVRRCLFMDSQVPLAAPLV